VIPPRKSRSYRRVAHRTSRRRSARHWEEPDHRQIWSPMRLAEAKRCCSFAQKQAALKVVQKRLVAEGSVSALSRRGRYQSRSENIVRALREQVPQVCRSSRTRLHQSRSIAEACRAHRNARSRDRSPSWCSPRVDPATGTSYRTLLGELMATESDGHFSDVRR